MLLNNISKLGKFSTVALVLMSASTLASTTTTTNFGSVSDTGNNFNEFTVSAGGVDMTVSGWSDTANFSGGSSSNPLTGDDKIASARDFDANGDGWSMENRDEAKTDGTQKTWNDGYHHSADNLSDGSSQDYDMFLIEFSEAVNLSAATYSWIYGSSSTKVANNQVTVAALNNGDLNGKNWADVASNTNTISSGYSQVESNSGYYTDFTTSTSNVSGVFSQFWLVGALNTVFGGDIADEGNDGMKFSGVSFTTQPGTPPPPTTVAEPTTIAIFGLALIGLFASSRRKIK